MPHCADDRTTMFHVEHFREIKSDFHQRLLAP